MLPLLAQKILVGHHLCHHLPPLFRRKEIILPHAISPVYFPLEGCHLTLSFPYFTRKPTSCLDGLKISESKYIKWNKCQSSTGEQSENKTSNKNGTPPTNEKRRSTQTEEQALFNLFQFTFANISHTVLLMCPWTLLFLPSPHFQLSAVWALLITRVRFNWWKHVAARGMYPLTFFLLCRLL